MLADSCREPRAEAREAHVSMLHVPSRELILVLSRSVADPHAEYAIADPRAGRTEADGVDLAGEYEPPEPTGAESASSCPVRDECWLTPSTPSENQ